LEEVDEKILLIRGELQKKIKEMPQDVEQQKKLVKSLINLEFQQSGSLQSERLKIEYRASYLEETFKTTFDSFLAKELQQGGESRDTSLPPVCVLFCEELTKIATGQFPDLWRLEQAYFTGELRGINEPKPKKLE
jgi:exocyst complex component 2